MTRQRRCEHISDMKNIFVLQSIHRDTAIRLIPTSMWTKTLWIYDLRTNKNVTLKANPLVRADLDEFVTFYQADDRSHRQPSWTEASLDGRWRASNYADLLTRDNVSLDIFWLRDESPEDSANLPHPYILATESMEDLQAALEQFSAIAEDLMVPADVATQQRWC
jgi:type I restriction enzyme M protein